MPGFQGSLVTLAVGSLLLSACGTPAAPAMPTAIPDTRISPTPAPTNALPTPVPIQPLGAISYRNLFQEYLGKPDSEVQGKLETAWQQLFYGDNEDSAGVLPGRFRHGLY